MECYWFRTLSNTINQIKVEDNDKLNFRRGFRLAFSGSWREREKGTLFYLLALFNLIFLLGRNFSPKELERGSSGSLFRFSLAVYLWVCVCVQIEPTLIIYFDNHQSSLVVAASQATPSPRPSLRDHPSSLARPFHRLRIEQWSSPFSSLD